MPQETRRGTKPLRCSGPPSYPHISCELAGSWQWFCCPDLKLNIIFPSKWQNMQIEDIGSKPGMRCSRPLPHQGSGIACSVPRGRTISKSLMLQVFLQIVGPIVAHVPPLSLGTNSFFGLQIQICALGTGCINVTAKRFQICVLSSSVSLQAGSSPGFRAPSGRNLE